MLENHYSDLDAHVDAALREISRGLVHEANNKLTIILAAAQILHIQGTQNTPLVGDDIREWSSSIEKNCQHLVDMLSGVVALGVRGGNQEASNCRLDLLVGVVEKICHGTFKKQNIDLHFTYAAALKGAKVKVQRAIIIKLLLCFVLYAKDHALANKHARLDIHVDHSDGALLFSLTNLVVDQLTNSASPFNAFRVHAEMLGGQLFYEHLIQPSSLVLKIPATIINAPTK